MTDNSIDVMYKTFAFIGFLFLLYFMPATRKFTVYAAGAILLILILQSSPTANYSSAPATSTLPLPTQIGTQVPQPQSSSSSSQGSSSSGSGGGLLSFLGDALGIAGLFA